MPRRRSPIVELANPLSFHDAVANGIGRRRLASPAVEHPFWGVVRERPEESSDDSFLDSCRAFAVRMPDHQFFSHGTALRLIGAPTPSGASGEMHVAAHRPSREPRTRGVVGHRLQVRDSATLWVHGLRVEHPVRAWRQVGGRWSALALTQIGDFLIGGRRPLATVEELRHELHVMGGTPALRAALVQLRVGSESPRETELRLILTGAGLPEPELNVSIYGGYGEFVARLDLFYRRYRVAVEYDGRQHAIDERQYRRDSDRWDAIRDEGILHVRILNHHMRDGGRPAVSRVRKALIARGWQP
ncbi:conserved hypothetical protein [Microbacterium sp. C448]|uniref:hypothetical protein n=1 Tax=Microbacterium sp. C448 TaxID=1177594 RepID=UPI0003DE5D2F|nr:hypothetical protein [Microbacterium sp. C448]CDJ98865.1 conserved hypothetical protein [Microbacterium sp. C448]